MPTLRERERDFAADSAQGSGLNQYAAIVGDEARAFSMQPPPRRRVGDSDLITGIGEATAQEAVEAIAVAARGRRIVILNEAHFASQCRGFALAVAQRLARDGFNWFAAEAFATRAPFWDEVRPGVPVTRLFGYYVADPVFAELVRGVRDGGYRLAAYEQYGDQRAAPEAPPQEQIARREEAQALNLIARVLDKDPQSRVLIYCGYSHAAKVAMPSGMEWMAARLKAKTGLDPLTIAQALGVAPPPGTAGEPLWTAVTERFRPETSVVVRRADGAAFTNEAPPGAFDLAVYHPQRPLVEGRPGWLAAAPGRVRAAFTLPAPAAVESLIQAVPMAEAGVMGALPSDHYLLAPGVGQATFFLRPGPYEVRQETDAGRKVIGTLTA